MSLYFFDIEEGGDITKDIAGEALASEETALTTAKQIALDLARDLSRNGNVTVWVRHQQKACRTGFRPARFPGRNLS